MNHVTFSGPFSLLKSKLIKIILFLRHRKNKFSFFALAGRQHIDGFGGRGVTDWSGGKRPTDAAPSADGFVEASFDASRRGGPSCAAVLRRVSQAVIDCLALPPAYLKDLPPTLYIHRKPSHVTVHPTHIFSFVYLYFHSPFCFCQPLSSLLCPSLFFLPCL